MLTPTAISTTDSQSTTTNALSSSLEQYWGFESFRPLQLEAMEAVMADRDSLVVFPTGGGKSLCFQAPATCREGLGVVISPLISLMKDQVDALQACGIRAAFLNSSLSMEEAQEVVSQVQRGELQLLYVAPERLLMDRTLELLDRTTLSFFAIDEAHCVSQWGHDFRPEYRGLRILKKRFPGVGVHAYTATAPRKVRADIIEQLGLTDTEILVGSMDRPNLNYQIRRRSRGLTQITDVLERHKGESGIIYCISRKDVERKSEALNGLGYSTLPYHAGLSPDVRKRNQEAFLREDVDIIVATVAFGMGIDKSNVRYVIHATMPKSLEAYQQESGRAGRDGLDAECWMFYTSGDFVTWKRLIEQSGSHSGLVSEIQSLQAISDFCTSIVCRHKSLAAHFDEDLGGDDCGACDVCMDEIELVDDPLTIAQKIISCVYRVDQRFGAEYVSLVLAGSRDKRILQYGHDRVSTYGIMAGENKQSVRMWIDQLVGQGLLTKYGDYNVIAITEKGGQCLKGDLIPRLSKAVEKEAPRTSKASKASWEGVDRDLFEVLKAIRSTEAKKRGVPAYVVFSDASLRDMARRRPSTVVAFHMVNGVGKKKLADYGELFLEAIRDHCESSGLETDVEATSTMPAKSETKEGPSEPAIKSFKHFDAGLSVAQAAAELRRAESTTRAYLQEYLRFKGVTDPSPWVDMTTAIRITEAASEIGSDRLKPIFVALDEQVSYDDIRVVMTCLRNEQESRESPSG